MKAVLTLDKFQFHKDTIKARKPPSHSNALPNFNSIKVRLKPPYRLVHTPSKCDFNSIKVQLKPIVFGYIISLFSIEFANAKLRNLIEKMSMGNYIFLCVLRQPLFFMVLQQVKELNDA